MACSSCAEQRRALRRAIQTGHVATATKIMINGAAKIVRDLSKAPRRTRTKG